MKAKDILKEHDSYAFRIQFSAASNPAKNL